jgi:hypothetical protein
MKTPTIAPAYAGLYAGLCEVAREHGYALAVHGSLQNDMDLVACPWTEEAADPDTLAAALYGRVKWIASRHDEWPIKSDLRAHGRRTYFFPLLQAAPNEGRSGIDLSIMPRAGA